MSFAKDIGSRVLAAAQSAKDEKKLQEKIEKEGGEVPESAKKGLFGRALKQQFVTNPINDLKKNFNKKLTGTAGIVGLFGGKGRALEDKMMGKKFSINKSGFDRSGYKKAQKEKPKTGGGGGGGAGGGGGPGAPTLGALVLDIQAIASAVSSMQGLISTQMSISSKMADSLGEIKNILGEQVSLQQQRIENEERAAMEASLESSQQVSGTDKATSTVTEGGGLLSMLGDLQSLFGILKSLPSMFMGLLRGLLSKIPGGKFLLDKFGGGAAKKIAGEAVEGGAKSLLGKFLRPIFKRIPIVGGLIDFAVSLALGEPIGRAAAKAAGATLGGALGGFLGSVFPGPGTIVGGLLGGFAGDWVGGSLYDAIAGAFGGDKEKKMASGGVMIGEAGKEAVVDLNSAEGKSQLGGGGPDMDSAGQSYYSAIAGSTLAVTKEFIDGMGPIGAAVAPVIQDDIAKLGQTFELPSTSIKMSVGGAGLSPVPGAEKKGEKFLEDLVSGSLEKVNSGKEKTRTGGGGSGGSSGGGDTGSSGGDTGSGAAAPTGAAPTGGAAAPVTAASFGAAQLAATTTSQTTTGGRSPQTVTTVNNKNLQKVTGSNPGKYYYDGLGNVYAIDKDEKRILKPDQLKNGVPGAAGNFNFFRNTNTGVVSLATHQDATSSGFYDYAANAVREPGFGPSGEQKNIWVPVGDAKQYKGQFTEATPYGKSKISAEDGASATLNKLGNGKLADAPRGRCVTGVLETMAANKIPNPQGTGNDGNNPRGLASQLIKNYGWGSIGGLGSKSNLKSPYGNVGVNTMDLGQWKTAVKSNKIPSGAIVFMTRNNDWSGNSSGGHDASIAKDGGKKLWSGHWQAQSDGVGAVYGSASNKIIALTPGGQQIPYDGSTSGDDGEDREDGEGTPENPFEAMEAGLKAMLVGAMVMAGNPKDKAEFEKLKKEAEASDAVTKMFGSTGNVTTPSTPAAPTRNTRGGGTSSPAAGSPQVIHVPTGSTPPSSLSRPAIPMSGTPGSLSPVRGV
jgi:hypothetical protein